MKLLIINYMALPLPPIKGGAVENLIDIFIQDNEQKNIHDITLISIYDEDAIIASKKYKYCSFQYINIQNIYDKLRIIVRHLINKIPYIYIGNAYINKIKKTKEINFNSYDAVIIENAPEFGLAIRKYVKGKLILHLHNDYLHSSSKLSRKILDCYDNVFALSDYIGDRVRGIYESNKIKTLHNGVDLNKFNRSLYNAKSIRDKYGLKESEIVIMYVGRLVPEKGVAELVQAFGTLSDEENIKLFIVGSARYSENIKTKYLSELIKIAEPFKEKVCFTGYIPYDNMPEIYSIADIGVVPSLCNEGFNLTVVEFMANGIPVIVSDNGAMQELINPKCGIVVSSKVNLSKEICDAIKVIIKDKKNLKEMKNESLKQSRLFSNQKYCERFNFLLNSKD